MENTLTTINVEGIDKLPVLKDSCRVLASIIDETPKSWLIDSYNMGDGDEGYYSRIPKSRCELTHIVSDPSSPTRQLFIVPDWIIKANGVNVYSQSQNLRDEEIRRKEFSCHKEEKPPSKYREGTYKTKLEMVEAHKDVLCDMNQFELTEFGHSAGCKSGPGFAAYKVALGKIGIDYDALKKQRHKEVADSIEESIDHEVVFYTDYSSSHGKMAVLDGDRNVIAVGYNNLEQSAGEAEAIILAIDQAIKQRKAGWVRAIVYSDAKWLTYANEVFKPGSKHGKKARRVGEYAKRNHVKLEVRWIRGSENPADGPSRS